MHGRQNVGNAYRQIFLEHYRRICYIVNRKGTTAHKVVDLIGKVI